MPDADQWFLVSGVGPSPRRSGFVRAGGCQATGSLALFVTFSHWQFDLLISGFFFIFLSLFSRKKAQKTQKSNCFAMIEKFFSTFFHIRHYFDNFHPSLQNFM